MEKQDILQKRRTRYREKNSLDIYLKKELDINRDYVNWKYAEAICNTRLIELGYETFLPFINNGEIDIIAYKDNQTYKIQVKAFSPKNKDIIYVDLTRNNYKERKVYTNIDWFLIYDGNYIYKVEFTKDLHSINLRYKAPKNQGSRIKMASDYIF